MSAETNILKHELAETRRKLAEAAAELSVLQADLRSAKRIFRRIEKESGDQFACEMAKMAGETLK